MSTALPSSRDGKNPTRLFVYGSLQPGRRNAHILEPIGGTWRRATVRGSLRQEGWGVAFGFPGMVLDEAGEEISGSVLESPSLPDCWQQLDDFEGKEYHRVVCRAELSDGRTVDAYVYVLTIAGDATP